MECRCRWDGSGPSALASRSCYCTSFTCAGLVYRPQRGVAAVQGDISQSVSGLVTLTVIVNRTRAAPPACSTWLCRTDELWRFHIWILEILLLWEHLAFLVLFQAQRHFSHLPWPTVSYLTVFWPKELWHLHLLQIKKKKKLYEPA